MNNWLGGLFFVHYVLLGSTESSQCQVCQLNSHRLPVFDGKSASDFPLTTQEGLGKLWMCTRMCSEDSRCRSYRYNNMTGVCSTYGVGYSTSEKTFNTVSMETGSQLHLMCGETHAFGTACESTADCEFSASSCRGGTCDCSLGYSYDVNSGDCVTNCARYGDFFAKYPKYGVTGCNIGSGNTPTDDGCMEACRSQTAFVCVNTDYESSTGECYMCDRAWFDLNPVDRSTGDNGWIMYYRHCAL